MKRFKINWAIPGLMAMILIIVGVAWVQSQAATSPDPTKLAATCGSCHTMDSQVTTWQSSSHKDVACTECHADPGAKGWVKMQWGRLQMIQSDGKDVDLSKVATIVPNERCMNCHARQMPWVMQDLKPPQLDENGEPIRVATSELKFLSGLAGHDVHLTKDNPLSCTECHGGVSHGPAPEKRLDHVQVMHTTCLECHAKENVSVAVRTNISCSACHADMDKVVPEDHQQTTFRQSHGKDAANAANNCQQCHLTPGMTANAPHTVQTIAHAPSKNSVVPQLPPGSLRVPEKITDACASCHGTTMPHPEAWLTQHAQGFNEQPELCASCHGTRDQGFNMTFKGDPRTLSTTDAKCVSCHAQPMPHPEGWTAQGHQTQAKLAPVTCEQCHSPKNPANPEAAHASKRFCSDCHLNSYSHPKGWVGSHKTVMVAYKGNLEAAGCTQCHAESGSSKTACTSCHTGGLKQKTEWHPNFWWVKHAQTTTVQNKAACATCHDYIQPSCSKCHTKY